MLPPAPPKSTSTTSSTPAPTTTKTSTKTSTTSVYVPPSTSAAPPTTTEVIPLPTAEPHSCPTPGTYTFSATTITVTDTTTVCDATTTHVPAGTHTVGGVTTIVETATTVTCPYATVKTSGGVVTSVIETTEYVCPSAGTYTIAPITTVVDVDCTITYPVPTSYLPGTYTAPEKVVTVTEVDYVYWCPFTSQGLPTTTPAPAPVAPTTTKVTVAPTTKTPSKPKVTKTPSTGGVSLGENGGHHAVTYNAYDRETGDCLSLDQVKKDLSDIKGDGFDTVRIYSTDCHTLEYVGEACEELGMQMIIGVFIKETGCSIDSADIKEQVDTIAGWANWSLVKLFVVGNEAMMNGFCTPEELATLITDIKGVCSTYTGPYTTTDTIAVWQRDDVPSALCGAIDVTAANIHAYFNPETTPDKAGDFVVGQLDILETICPGNEVINLECGWPTEGKCNGVACPGVANQAEAIKSIVAAAGDKTVFFSMWSEKWKVDGDCGCERSWGAKPCFSS